MNILTFIGTVLKVALEIFSAVKKKPSDQRSEALAELDDALKKAFKEKRVKEFSKWLGKHL